MYDGIELKDVSEFSPSYKMKSKHSDQKTKAQVPLARAKQQILFSHPSHDSKKGATTISQNSRPTESPKEHVVGDSKNSRLTAQNHNIQESLSLDSRSSSLEPTESPVSKVLLDIEKESRNEIDDDPSVKPFAIKIDFFEKKSSNSNLKENEVTGDSRHRSLSSNVDTRSENHSDHGTLFNRLQGIVMGSSSRRLSHPGRIPADDSHPLQKEFQKDAFVDAISQGSQVDTHGILIVCAWTWCKTGSPPYHQYSTLLTAIRSIDTNNVCHLYNPSYLHCTVATLNNFKDATSVLSKATTKTRRAAMILWKDAILEALSAEQPPIHSFTLEVTHVEVVEVGCIVHFSDPSGSINRLRGCISQASEDPRLREFERLEGMPSRALSKLVHIPNIIHSTFIRFKSAPTEEFLNDLRGVVALWSPIPIEVTAVFMADEYAPYMHVERSKALFLTHSLPQREVPPAPLLTPSVALDAADHSETSLQSATSSSSAVPMSTSTPTPAPTPLGSQVDNSLNLPPPSSSSSSSSAPVAPRPSSRAIWHRRSYVEVALAAAAVAGLFWMGVVVKKK